jgi:hypothetical protein
VPGRVIISGASLALALFLCASAARAQSVCESGNGLLDPSQPSARTPADIIKKFAANEAVFKAAKDNYGYVLDVEIETLNGNNPTGEYRLTSQIALDLFGKPSERTTFAPQSSLRGMSLSEDDLQDIRTRLPFNFTPQELPQFSVSYVGRQHVDQLDTYAFNVSPKNPKTGAKLFDGRIWVEDQDLAIVKTCGKPRRGDNETAKRGPVEAVPTFVTFREQVDGKYWLTTYAHADEYLNFRKYSIHVRETIKYSDFKPLNTTAASKPPH